MRAHERASTFVRHMRSAQYSTLESPEPPSRPSMFAKGCCGVLLVTAMVAFCRSGAVAAEARGGSHRRNRPSVESHQKGEVSSSLLALRRMPKAHGRILARLVADDAPIPPGSKKVQFIRHGEGYHNVAQREWRARPGWDGKTEPYTVDTDPNGRYVDAMLTDEGEAQARALQARTTREKPQLLVVSPMRRATQTGLLAFAPQVDVGWLPVVAHELCHERAGRHTCDRRLSRTELSKQFGARVSYALLESEEDPYWGDGVTREPWEGVVGRGIAFAAWLRAQPEAHVAVAAHSAWLLAMFNAVLTTDDGDEETRGWFGTGEMRTVLLTWQ